jgi:hypothetical protein
VSVVPYEKYLEYTDAFIHTILVEKDFETDWEEYTLSSGPKYIAQNKSIKDIGAYSPKYQ